MTRSCWTHDITCLAKPTECTIPGVNPRVNCGLIQLLIILDQYLFISCNKRTSLVQGVGLPGGSVGKESACNEGDLDSIPGSGRSSGGGHGNPLQYSCLENPMDGGSWRATVHRVTKRQTRLSDSAYKHTVQGVNNRGNSMCGGWWGESFMGSLYFLLNFLLT